jgi:hypothetical protein
VFRLNLTGISSRYPVVRYIFRDIHVTSTYSRPLWAVPWRGIADHWPLWLLFIVISKTWPWFTILEYLRLNNKRKTKYQETASKKRCRFASCSGGFKKASLYQSQWYFHIQLPQNRYVCIANKHKGRHKQF